MGSKLNPNSMIGKKFNRLTIEEFVKEEKRPYKNAGGYDYYYKCKCDCENYIITTLKELRREHKKSCGCLKSENSKNMIMKFCITKNGETVGKYKRLYHIWNGMKERCYNQNCKEYKYYGKNGISICEDWKDYESFKIWSLDNGYNDLLTIDRIDVNGNYEPSNCRWVTMKEQCNNKSTNKYIEYQGKTQTLAQWCEELDLNYDRVLARLNRCNWTVEQAFELPLQQLKRKIN